MKNEKPDTNLSYTREAAKAITSSLQTPSMTRLFITITIITISGKSNTIVQILILNTLLAHMICYEVHQSCCHKFANIQFLTHFSLRQFLVHPDREEAHELYIWIYFYFLFLRVLKDRWFTCKFRNARSEDPLSFTTFWEKEINPYVFFLSKFSKRNSYNLCSWPERNS